RRVRLVVPCALIANRGAHMRASIILFMVGLLHWAVPSAQDVQSPPAADLGVAVEAATSPDLSIDTSASADDDVAPAMEWLRKPAPDVVVCPFRGRIDYEPGEIECGLIQVPENREVAGSHSI